MRAVVCIHSSSHFVLQEIDDRGWELYALGDQLATPLDQALVALETGHAQVLVADELGALCKSVVQFGSLLDRSRVGRWELVVLQPRIDTTTDEGLEDARCMAWAGRVERDLLYVRLVEDVERSGRRVGRPPAIPPQVVQEIRVMWNRRMSQRAIARKLTDDGVPTAHGGRRWYASTVGYVLDHHPGSR